MSSLSYGLNVPKKGLNGLQKNRPKKTIFDDDLEDDKEPPENEAEEISSFGGRTKPKATTPSKPSAPPKPSSKLPQPGFGSTDLSARLAASRHAAAAEELDPTIYDYDAVYDKIHVKPAKTKEKSTGPKYMKEILESAEVRKRDQLRAKEKMLAKERETEGEEFADKEKFVTGAYKAQQAEIKRLEEEEREREEEAAERRRREGGGMRGLYKGMLDREDARHQAISEAVVKGATEDENEAEPDREMEETRLAKQKGAVVNDEGQIVDKRQLLSAGLNVAATPAPTLDSRKKATAAPSMSMNILSGRPGAKAAMRERQSRMLEEQLEQSTKRAAEEDILEQESLKKAAKTRKTEGEVSSARERYLQRKREAEAAEAAGREP